MRTQSLIAGNLKNFLFELIKKIYPKKITELICFEQNHDNVTRSCQRDLLSIVVLLKSLSHYPIFSTDLIA